MHSHTLSQTSESVRKQSGTPVVIIQRLIQEKLYEN